MKTLFAFALFSLFLATTTMAQQQQQQPQFPIPNFPRFPDFPRFPVFPRPSGNGNIGENCWKALGDPTVGQCLESLQSFFQTHQLSSVCCSTLKNIEGACGSVAPIFDPLMQTALTQFCSKAPAPPKKS